MLSSFAIAIWLCFSISCLAVTSGRIGGGHIAVSEDDVRVALESVSAGTGGVSTDRLEVVERAIWQTFQALPKNSYGRLGPNAVRHIAHKYFAKEHGWLIKGLESRGMSNNAAKMYEAGVLQDKAPTVVAALMRTQNSEHGLSLNDVVAMISVLEYFIFDESVEVLAASYRLNGLSTLEQIDEKSLHKVLASYLIVFGQGDLADFNNVTLHEEQMETAESTGVLQELVDFEGDTVGNYNFERRHRTLSLQRYTYEAVTEITRELSKNYGKWQNTDCLQMKAALMELDPEQSGRVPVGSFFNQPEGATFHFTESVDYLRQIGALEETAGSAPRVLITNYLAGPSNCIATSSYYSVCCLNECEALMSDLEEKVQAPTTAPDHLLRLVGNLSSPTVDTPREVSGMLADKLRVVAELNNGVIPLHGRLFAQWLHYAFPHECPFPSASGGAGELTSDYWLQDRAVAATEREMEEFINSVQPANTVYMPLSQWSDNEVLPLNEQLPSGQITFLTGVRYIVQVTAVVLVLHAAIKAGQTATWTFSGANHKKKIALPLHY